MTTMSQAKPSEDQSSWVMIFVCWLVASIATLGSLYFSEVMEIQPCVLCWYQRIFMYPLVVIFLVGMFPLDRNVFRYAMPVALAGWGFSVYHYFVYKGFIPENLQPCSQGVSCSEIKLEILGFITIPMLSILSFSAIIVVMIIFNRRTKS